MNKGKQVGKNLQCSQHKREIEGFCKECQMYLCSSCMFATNNLHKSHTLMNMPELGSFLRSLIVDNSAILKHEYCDDFIINIRQVKSSLIQSSEKLIERIDKEAASIMMVIQERRNAIVNEIKANLEEELQKIKDEETKWLERKEITKQIIGIQIDADDKNVSQNMELIIEGMKEISQPVLTKEYKTIGDYDLNLKDKNMVDKLELDNLYQMMGMMFVIQPNDIISIPYKS